MRKFDIYVVMTLEVAGILKGPDDLTEVNLKDKEFIELIEILYIQHRRIYLLFEKFLIFLIKDEKKFSK